MYAKSFIALDGKGRQTGARTAQIAPYDRYTCHLCNSALQYHPGYDTECPWFEHTCNSLTEHCPYAAPDVSERQLIHRRQCLLPDAVLLVARKDWHCGDCGSDYHCERYCLVCRAGSYSTVKHSGETCLPGHQSVPYFIT